MGESKLREAKGLEAQVHSVRMFTIRSQRVMVPCSLGGVRKRVQRAQRGFWLGADGAEGAWFQGRPTLA